MLFILLSMALGGLALSLNTAGAGLPLCAGGLALLSRMGLRSGGRELLPIAVTYRGRTVRALALRDTGNTLRDPITGEQVLVIGPEDAKILTGLTDDQLQNPMETILRQRGLGLRLIPYHSVGQSGGMLLAKRMEQVQVDGWEGSAIVAFAPDRIGTGEVYQALTGGAL